MTRPAGLGVRARARADAAGMAPADADELCVAVVALLRDVAARLRCLPEHLAAPPAPLEAEAR